MRRIASVVFILATCALAAPAHPGSGIVVDRHGNVYYVDTGTGIWKIDRNGARTRLSGPAYHWMTLDPNAQLRGVSLPYFSAGDATVTRAGGNPDLFVASDFPICVGKDGSLIYPWLSAGDRLQLYRLAPSGATTVLKEIPTAGEANPPRWLNGLAVGPDGSVYYTEHRRIRKIAPDGSLSTLVDNITLPGCSQIPGIGPEQGAYLRGLDVDSLGTLYVAATGCGSVLRITPGGDISTILRASAPWSPTGVAVSGKDVYVLEYLHTEGDNRREWIPRVRKVSSDGRVITITP